MYLVGVAGGSGSGKTTFAEKVIKRLPARHVAMLHMDNYYLHKQPKDNYLDGEPNYDSPQAFDWKLFAKHLDLLKRGKKIEVPLYNFNQSKRSFETVDVGPCKAAIVEGLLTLWNEDVRNLLDLKIYMKVESDIRFTRRLYRDISDRGRQLDDIIDQYYKSVRPMHIKFTQPTQQYADIIIGEHHDAAVDLLVHHIQAQLQSKKK